MVEGEKERPDQAKKAIQSSIDDLRPSLKGEVRLRRNREKVSGLAQWGKRRKRESYYCEAWNRLSNEKEIGEKPIRGKVIMIMARKEERNPPFLRRRRARIHEEPIRRKQGGEGIPKEGSVRQ